MIINSLKWIDKEKGIRVWMQSLRSIEKVISSIRSSLRIDDGEADQREENKEDIEF